MPLASLLSEYGAVRRESSLLEEARTTPSRSMKSPNLMREWGMTTRDYNCLSVGNLWSLCVWGVCVCGGNKGGGWSEPHSLPHPHPPLQPRSDTLVHA